MLLDRQNLGLPSQLVHLVSGLGAFHAQHVELALDASEDEKGARHLNWSMA